MIPSYSTFFLNDCFTFNLSFSFISDIRKEIISKHKSVLLEGLIRVDPGIADMKDQYFNNTLLHYAVICSSSSCVEVLLKLAPHLFDVVTKSNNTPLHIAKKHYPDSIEVITMLEDHLKNR